MTNPAYRGRHRAPAGRHRPVKSTARSRTTGTGLPSFRGSAYVLPTAAAATLVLTVTGAHLGGSGTPSASAAGNSAAAAALTSSVVSGGDPIQRDLQERASRSSGRGLTSAGAGSSAENGTDAAGTDATGTDVTTGSGTNGSPATATELEQPRFDAAGAIAAQQEAAAKAQSDAAAAQAASDAAAQAAAVAATKAGKSWVPFITTGYTLTSGFGMRWGAMHPGQDFAVPVGTPVRAMSSGKVIFAGWQGGYGNKVEIQYWDGTVSWFCHNSKLLVSEGDTVTPGELVSLSGNTGHSTGPHIHVEIHPNGDDPIPPIPWLTKMGTMP